MFASLKLIAITVHKESGPVFTFYSALYIGVGFWVRGEFNWFGKPVKTPTPLFSLGKLFHLQLDRCGSTTPCQGNGVHNWHGVVVLSKLVLDSHTHAYALNASIASAYACMHHAHAHDITTNTNSGTCPPSEFATGEARACTKYKYTVTNMHKRE